MSRFILLFGLLLSLVMIGKAEAHTVYTYHPKHLAQSSWFCYRDSKCEQHFGSCTNPQLVAANNTLPKGTILWVRYPATGKSVHVRVVGTGPFVPGRVLDLSCRAAIQLGYFSSGVAALQVLSIHKPNQHR